MQRGRERREEGKDVGSGFVQGEGIPAGPRHNRTHLRNNDPPSSGYGGLRHGPVQSGTHGRPPKDESSRPMFSLAGASRSEWGEEAKILGEAKARRRNSERPRT